MVCSYGYKSMHENADCYVSVSQKYRGDKMSNGLACTSLATDQHNTGTCTQMNSLINRW